MLFLFPSYLDTYGICVYIPPMLNEEEIKNGSKIRGKIVNGLLKKRSPKNEQLTAGYLMETQSPPQNLLLLNAS